MPDRWLLVTGGSSGLGASIAARAAGNFKVLIVDRAEPPLGEWIRADIGDRAAAAAAGRLAAERTGGSLAAVVLCAGVNVPAAFTDQSDEDWEGIVETNLLGNLRIARRCLPSLIATRGRLVVVGSTFSGRGRARMSAYCAAKSALRATCESLGAELAPHVAVTHVQPSTMDTAFFDGRLDADRPPPRARMRPGAVADAVWAALTTETGIVIRDMTITGDDPDDWP